MNIVIIGNSGSGKTWLAEQLRSRIDTSVVHLDDLFWEPGGFDKKRRRESIEYLIRKSQESTPWIAEGVFGELALYYSDTADLLVWLDLSWSVCKRRLMCRGSESKKQHHRLQSEKGLAELLQWASQYTQREDLRSYQGHKEIFVKFAGNKVWLKSENDVDSFVAAFPKSALTERS